VALALACSDSSRAPTQLQEAEHSTDGAAASLGAGPLRVPVSGTLSDGGVFHGTLTVQHFSVHPDFVPGPDAPGPQLVVTGLLSGKATLADGRVVHVNNVEVSAPATLGGDVAASAAEQVVIQQLACPILNLDLGPLHLDLLGLVIDLSPVSLDITAVPGPGNLLGNLLCAIVGLFDIPGTIAIIQQLLDIVNQLLGGLG
jgi:hypothetical protein